MRYGEDREERAGFTLVEIMITLAILGILVVIAVSDFRGLNEKYNVEAETKQLYADLMDARGRAMQRNRWFFVRISLDGYGYKTYEDSSPAPDGGGPPLDNIADTLVTSATVRHVITNNLAGGNDFGFNRNGIASDNGTIRLSSTALPDYDCITIQMTRIKMGQYNAIGNTCAEK